MPIFVALLRAVNVGGTTLLPMRSLTTLCTELGFVNVRTYIQSGNVVFESRLSSAKTHAALERALAAHMGKKVDVILRDAAALRKALADNPFPDAPPAKVAVAFCSGPVDRALFDRVVAPGGEQVVAGDLEFYVYYPDGMGRSKLNLPRIDGAVTVRNINTVARLVAMSDDIAASRRPARG